MDKSVVCAFNLKYVYLLEMFYLQNLTLRGQKELVRHYVNSLLGHGAQLLSHPTFMQ